MRARVLVVTVLASAFALRARDSRAQDQPSGNSLPGGASGAVIVPPKDEPPLAPKRAALVPPHVKSDDGAVYPKQAVDDAVDHPVTVTLIVDIDPQGHVKSARVETPQGHGFDEAALDAAKTLVFDPATRDGTPIASRVKHVYAFTPPASRLVGRVFAAGGVPILGAQVTARDAAGVVHSATTDAMGQWRIEGLEAGTFHVAVAAPSFKPHESDEVVRFGQEAASIDRLEPLTPEPPAPGEEAAEDVFVRGQKPPREVTVYTLDQRELERIPGTNGDALKGILNLPGVARPPGISGLLIVRGSAPQDTQVFVDGTAIPLVYHFGGLSSVVPTEMLGKIDFYPGNYSAQYGRGMGGIVDAGLASPKDDRIHALAQVDLIDARVMAQGPIGDGWKFAIAGRRSWVDVWLKPVLEAADAGVTAAPVYYDYQAVLEKDWNHHKESFRAALFGSDDNLAILLKTAGGNNPTLGGGISSHMGFWRGQVRYVDKFSSDTELHVVGAIGQDFTQLSIGDIYFNVTTLPISSRVELSQKLSPQATMNFGLDLLYEPYDVNALVPAPDPAGLPPPGPILSKPPISVVSKDAISRPAFYDEVELTPWAGGRIVPGLRLDYSKDTQDWDFAPRVSARQDLTTGFPRTTIKGAAGVYYQPPQPQETNATFGQVGLRSNRATEYDLGFEQEITRHVELTMDGFYKQEDDLVVAGNFNNGTGRAYGVETLLRWKPDARFFGWLAYTLSRSLLRDGPGQPEHLSPYDQTHILTVLGSYRLGRGWELGARFRITSGDPFTPHAYGFYDENNSVYLPLNGYPSFSQRLPLFHQLDIRVDKTWKFQSWQFSAYLDVQNVYNQSNVEGTNANYNNTQSSYVNGLPILPSLGFRAEF